MFVKNTALIGKNTNNPLPAGIKRNDMIIKIAKATVFVILMVLCSVIISVFWSYIIPWWWLEFVVIIVCYALIYKYLLEYVYCRLFTQPPVRRDKQKEMKKQLKLFIWRDVLSDYTPGIAFAMACDVDEARKKIREEIVKEKWQHVGKYADSIMEELHFEPEIHDKPFGTYLFGGG